MDPRLRALNGFGLGARAGEAQRVGEARDWLRSQLDGPAPRLTAPATTAPAAVGAALRALRASRGDPAEQRAARRRVIEIAAADGLHVLAERITTGRPFVERLVAFWANHLCVSSASKPIVAALAGGYEREVIRPHVLGRYEDMVLASARHPAMLLYLDNAQSIGPQSPAARLARRGRGRGMNENYARELLELHTLGVDGGYTQGDVQELARMLTGWTVVGLAPAATQRSRAGGRPTAPSAGSGDAMSAPTFTFAPRLHEPGPRVLLGVRYPEGGAEQAEQAIRALCRHRSTAQSVATRLVTHFVSDQPPAAAVARVARVFHETAGDLRAVAAALIDLPDAWGGEARKFRSPQDWLVAVLRAFGVTRPAASSLLVLRQLRHPLWSPPAPSGFADTLQAWADPDALLNRAELARTVTRFLDDARHDPVRVADVVAVEPGDPLRALIADATVPAADRLALAVAGPAFQWR